MPGTKGQSGGARVGAGRPRQFKHVKIPIALYAPCSEPEPLTPESDLTIYRAEADERRGIVIGDIWYGYGEAIAIAEYVAQFRDWLVDKAQANREREN